MQSKQLIHSYVLNPKCIKMGELYGEYNLLTNEWTDGLVGAAESTCYMRQTICHVHSVHAQWQ